MFTTTTLIFLLTIIPIGFVLPELFISLFGIQHKNKIIDLIIQILTCKKCFTFWFSILLFIIFSFPFQIIFISTAIIILLEKL